MDSRLKEVLDQVDREKLAQRQKQEQIKAAELLRIRQQEELDQARAIVWIQKHLFSAILEAERANSQFCLSDNSESFGPSHEGIPAAFLAREAAKIDGISIVPRLVEGYSDPDYGKEPSYHVYDMKIKR